MQDMVAQRHVEYSAEEETALRNAVQARFGPVDQVLREVGSPELRVDLWVVSPAAGRPFYTVVTCGMGARTMPVPEGLEHYCRAELAILLPEDWDLHQQQECCYWPLRWLKLLARLPWEESSWLGLGHTVPNGEPFAENTDFSALLLYQEINAEAREGAGFFQLPSGEPVRLYQLFALYEEELAFGLEHGASALLERLEQENMLSPVLHLARRNLFPSLQKFPQKHLKLEKHLLRPLLRDWQGPAGCLATDRILVDGAAVGYCYREAPAGEWDSGWRFTAGDESDEYMDDPRHSDIYTLNCIVNYDMDILPILSAEAPCAFARGGRGLERLKVVRGT